MGRHRAGADIAVAVRDFDLLDRINAILTGNDQISIDGVRWSVDHDNPAWRGVRADAIQVAIAKGRDYATALGGMVTAIAHIADSGLLGSDRSFGSTERAVAPLGLSGGGQAGTPSVDPVPQELHATIEMRLIATAAPLARS